MTRLLVSILALGGFVLSAASLAFAVRQWQVSSRRMRAEDQAEHDAKVAKETLERARVDGIEKQLEELRRRRGEST